MELVGLSAATTPASPGSLVVGCTAVVLTGLVVEVVSVLTGLVVVVASVVEVVLTGLVVVVASEVVVVASVVEVVLTGLVVVVVASEVVVVASEVEVVLAGLVVVVASLVVVVASVVVVVVGSVVEVVVASEVVVVASVVEVVLAGLVVVVTSLVVVVGAVPHGGWLTTNWLNSVTAVPEGNVSVAVTMVAGAFWFVVASRKWATAPVMSVKVADPELPSANVSCTAAKSDACGVVPDDVVTPFMTMCQPSRDGSQPPSDDAYGRLDTLTVDPGPTVVALAPGAMSDPATTRSAPRAVSVATVTRRYDVRGFAAGY